MNLWPMLLPDGQNVICGHFYHTPSFVTMAIVERLVQMENIHLEEQLDSLEWALGSINRHFPTLTYSIHIYLGSL